MSNHVVRYEAMRRIERLPANMRDCMIPLLVTELEEKIGTDRCMEVIDEAETTAARILAQELGSE